MALCLLVFLFLGDTIAPCRPPNITHFTLGPVLLRVDLTLSCCDICQQIKTVWYLNDTPVATNSTLASLVSQNSNGRLRFLKSSPLLSGDYRCLVSSACGSSSIPPITVYYNNLSESSVIISKLEGETAEIICNTTNSFPAGLVRYSVESLNIVNKRYISISDRLIIVNLIKSDSGFYRCKILSDSYEFYTETVGLIVHPNANLTNRQPKCLFPRSGHVFRILENQTSDIKCAFDGRPEPSVVYYNLSGYQVSQKDMKNNEEYVCVGTNLNVFSDRRQFRVVIEQKPWGSLINYRQSVYGGQKYTFNLSITGKPLPKISWFIGNSMSPILPGSPNHSIQPGNEAIKIIFGNRSEVLSFLLQNSHGTYFRSYEFNISSVSRLEEPRRLSNDLIFTITFTIIGVLLLILLIIALFRVRKLTKWKSSQPKRSSRVESQKTIKHDFIPDMYDMTRRHHHRECNI